MRRMWPRARVAWAAAGVLVLAVSAAGAFVFPRSPAENAPARERGFVFRAHEAPRPVATLGFEDADGRPRTLAGFRDRVVLLNVWATWCVPCREEMPALDRLQQKLGGPDFEVVALSIDAGGAEAVKRFYGETGVRALAVYVDPASRSIGSLGLVGIPATLLIDRSGREIGRRTGPAEWDGLEALRMIESHLKGKGR